MQTITKRAGVTKLTSDKAEFEIKMSANSKK